MKDFDNKKDYTSFFYIFGDNPRKYDINWNAEMTDLDVEEELEKNSEEDAGCSFDEALKYLLEGYKEGDKRKIKRISYDAGVFISTMNNLSSWEPFLVKNKKDKFTPWCPTFRDIFAEDWILIKDN